MMSQYRKKMMGRNCLATTWKGTTVLSQSWMFMIRPIWMKRTILTYQRVSGKLLNERSGSEKEKRVDLLDG